MLFLLSSGHNCRGHNLALLALGGPAAESHRCAALMSVEDTPTRKMKVPGSAAKRWILTEGIGFRCASARSYRETAPGLDGSQWEASLLCAARPRSRRTPATRPRTRR